jgi:hypothetical protein
MWRIWWAPNNASKWYMRFNSWYKGLKSFLWQYIACLTSQLIIQSYSSLVSQPVKQVSVSRKVTGSQPTCHFINYLITKCHSELQSYGTITKILSFIFSLHSGWLRAGRSGYRNPVWGRDFPHLSRLALGSPPSLLYNGYRVFPAGKERPGRDADPSPPPSAVGHERVELYLYSPYGPYGLYRASVPVLRWPLPFYK